MTKMVLIEILRSLVGPSEAKKFAFVHFSEIHKALCNVTNVKYLVEM